MANRSQCPLWWTLALIPRTLLLGKTEQSALRCIKQTAEFDASFYRTQRPRNLTAQIFPLRHYIVWGEKKGLWPNARFSPQAYSANNPDLAEHKGNLLAHYIAQGRAEGRRPTSAESSEQGLPANLDCIPTTIEATTTLDQPRIAVAAHVFFPELWDDLSSAIRKIPEPFDLYCTVTLRPGHEATCRRVSADFPGATVIPFPNHGRDVFPFVHLVNSGLLTRYSAVCKVHTKKSPHTGEGDVWRRSLLDGILPAQAATHDLLQAFLNDDRIGLVAADECILSHRHFWGANRQRVEVLLRKLDMHATQLALRFPGGSFYWIKPEPLRLLQRLDLQAEDFEREAGQLDGTQAHAVERLIGCLVEACGQSVVGSEKLLSHAHLPQRV